MFLTCTGKDYDVYNILLYFKIHFSLAGPDIRGTLHIISQQTLPVQTEKSPKYVVIGGLTGSDAKVTNMCWVLETTTDGFLWQVETYCYCGYNDILHRSPQTLISRGVQEV